MALKSKFLVGSILATFILNGFSSPAQALELDEDTRINMLLPMINSTVEGISKEGIQRSMTGPYIRGDFDTINSHINILENFDPIISLAYNSLALYTLEKTQISNPTHKSINEKLLKSMKKNLEILNK